MPVHGSQARAASSEFPRGTHVRNSPDKKEARASLRADWENWGPKQGVPKRQEPRDSRLREFALLRFPSHHDLLSCPLPPAISAFLSLSIKSFMYFHYVYWSNTSYHPSLAIHVPPVCYPGPERLVSTTRFGLQLLFLRLPGCTHLLVAMGSGVLRYRRVQEMGRSRW